MNSCFSSIFKDEDKLLIYTCPEIPSLINNYYHLALNKNKILGLQVLRKDTQKNCLEIKDMNQSKVE